MKSMTGFGRGQFVGADFTVTVELKAVNNRFLDLNMRLTGELSPLEAQLKRQISERLSRGRVDVNVQYDRTSEIAYELNNPIISGFISAMKSMKDSYDLSGEIDINVLARLPNVMMPKRDDISEDFVNGIREATGAALDEIEKMRLAEGVSLGAELTARLLEIEKAAAVIEGYAESVVTEYQARLNKRISELLSRSESQIAIDQARIAQEVAFLADRSDISEELTRLRSHVEQFRKIMAESVDVGKRLDFLTQELNREANTITSKTGNLLIKEAALGIKAEVEKIREQVQNVE